MYVGIQFEAPDGYGTFRKGVRYYFAGDRSDGTVLIAWFERNKNVWRVHLMMPTRSDFEAAIVGKAPKLKRLREQFGLPPWLEKNEGLNFDELEARRYASKKQTYREQAEKRLFSITPALERALCILDSKDPLCAIAKTRKELEDPSSSHAHRLQVWFFAYLLHGQDIWALKKPTLAYAGTWSRRDDEHRDTKFGRPPLEGNCFGWSSALIREQILKSYLDRCALGKTMVEIHRSAMIEDFGCKVTQINGTCEYMHPANKPFPSYGQFRSVVVDELGLFNVQTKLFGAPRIRQKAIVDEGNTTQQYSNILEGLEVDAFYTERPTSIFSGDPAEKLAVARAICVATGAVVGVGFSLGAETGEAYRSMLFCMTVPKDYIESLYGLPVGGLNWIMQGLPPNFISDRGPAGFRKLAESLQQAFPIKSIVGSYEGQSKPSVESGHPRDVQTEGAPSYVQSDLNVVQMAQREVSRAAHDNHTSSIYPRLSDQAIHDFCREGRVATPHHLWQYLDERGRSSARRLSLHDAVRAFWTPIPVVVDRHGVRHRHRHYSSPTFRDTGAHRRLVAQNTVELTGYILSLVVICIWVEVDGRLIQVDAVPGSRIDREDMIIPEDELEKTERALASLKSRTRTSTGAAAAKAEADFAAATGKAWDAGRRVFGKPKRVSGTAAHESKVIKGTTARKKAA